MWFKTYLKNRVKKDNFKNEILEDFAKDCLRDKHFIKNYRTWDELENHLLFCRACPEALRADRQLFKQWQELASGKKENN